MKFGVISLLMGIIAIIFGVLLQPFSLFFMLNPIFEQIVVYLGNFEAILLLILLILVGVLLGIGSLILGVFGVKKDTSKGMAKGGRVVGIVGLIFNTIILIFYASLSHMFM